MHCLYIFGVSGRSFTYIIVLKKKKTRIKTQPTQQKNPKLDICR